MKVEVVKNERRKKNTVITEQNMKKGLIAVGILALITIGVVYFVIKNTDSWLTKSTIQRRAMPADQCQKIDTWFWDDTGYSLTNDEGATGRLITKGEEEYIIAGMEYFYEKTGVQPYLWAVSFYDDLQIKCHSPYERKKMRDQMMADKYEELFGSDGGHVLIAVSDSYKFPAYYYWVCYAGDNAKNQVMDEEAAQILMDCLSFMYEPGNVHPGRTIGNAFVKAADTMMMDQTFTSYAIAIVIVGVMIFIALICIASIRRSGKENVEYHKTLTAREEARKEEAIADQKQADLDRKKYEDELETQYVAIPCPNCGGSGNKIRMGTVGICKFCGTAIKVGRDGKVEFLSNDD